jgi:hypothetical protein
MAGLEESYESRSFQRAAAGGIGGGNQPIDLSAGAAFGMTVAVYMHGYANGLTLDLRKSLQVVRNNGMKEASIFGVYGGAGWEMRIQMGALELFGGLGMGLQRSQIWAVSGRSYEGWSLLGKAGAGLVFWYGSWGMVAAYESCRSSGNGVFDEDPGYEIRPTQLLLGITSTN